MAGVVQTRAAEQEQLFTLYRFRAADDTLLYVGITINPGRLFAKHASEKPWWGDVAKIALEQHPSLEALRKAERSTIQTEKPLHNIRMNGGSKAAREQTPARPTDDAPAGLVGRWFHSYRLIEEGEDTTSATVRGDHVREWQGQIIGRDGDLFIAQLYSWWDGCPSNEVVVEAEDVKLWRFFATNELMLVADGCIENRHDWNCGAPCTHVIRDWHGMGSIYRCEKHIRHYSGKVEEL